MEATGAPPSPVLPGKAEQRKPEGFTREHTALCKGVACMLLLFHHLFYREQMLGGCVTLLDQLTGGTRGLELVYGAAHAAKVCVALFLILSGCGLTESWKRTGGRAAREWGGFRFSLTHLLRLMCRYWLIFLLFVPFGALFGRDPAVLFLSSTPLKMWIKIAINFTGMSNLLFGSTQYTFNATWWYMSVMIPCYLLFPVLRRLSAKSPLLLIPVMALCALGMFVPYAKNIAFWIIPFLLGMLLSDYGVLDACVRFFAPRPAWLSLLAGVLPVLAVSLLRGRSAYYWDLLLAPCVILFCIAVLARSGALRRSLQFVGRHSGNIFLFHSFLCAYYFADIIYAPRYPLLILLLLLGASLLISMGIERLVSLLSALRGRIGRGGAPGALI